MIFDSLKRYKYSLGLLLIIVALVIYKYRFLQLPYYWDEAWPYGVAVRTMQAHGISLIPSSIPTFVARGHPLLFHFLAAEIFFCKPCKRSDSAVPTLSFAEQADTFAVGEQ